MNSFVRFVSVIVLAGLLATGVAQAGVGSKLFQETAEFIIRRGGKELAGESVETLTRKMSTLAARNPEVVIAAAFKRVGPRAAHIASEAGEQYSGVALKLLSQRGDDAIRIASRPKALQLVGRIGDDAIEPLIRHGEIGERLIEKFGSDGAEALGKLSEKNTRRLAMLIQEHGDKVSPGLVQLFAKHGSADTVAEWVWKRKGSLFVGAGLVAFLKDPQSFLDTAENVTSKTLDAAVKPVVTQAASQFPWALTMAVGLFLGGAFVFERIGVAKVLKAGLTIATAKMREVRSKPVSQVNPRPKENNDEREVR